jgi:hypothetical protein
MAKCKYNMYCIESTNITVPDGEAGVQGVFNWTNYL